MNTLVPSAIRNILSIHLSIYLSIYPSIYPTLTQDDPGDGPAVHGGHLEREQHHRAAPRHQRGHPPHQRQQVAGALLSTSMNHAVHAYLLLLCLVLPSDK